MSDDYDSESLLHDERTPEPPQALLEQQEVWRPTQHLDFFFTRIYYHFYRKGFYNLVMEQLLEIIITGFIIVLLAFLFLFIDYSILFSKHSLDEAIRATASGINPFVIIFLLAFFLFWVKQVYVFLVNLQEQWDMKVWYEQVLGITEKDLPNLEWNEILQRAIKVPGLCLIKNHSPLDVTNRIMRKENYLIAMINKKVFKLDAPCPLNMIVDGYDSLFTKAVEWAVSLVLFQTVFDKNQNLQHEFQKHSSIEGASQKLRQRFKVLGIICFIFSPFILSYLLAYYFFLYADEFRHQPMTLGSREWSTYAKLKFRELNELPHFFQKRLSLSYEPAKEFSSLFVSTLTANLARLVSFVFGSLVAVLVLLGLMDEQLLINGKLLDKQLIWYLGIFGTILAIARSFTSDPMKSSKEANKMLTQLSSHTHYLPARWRGKGHTTQVYEELTALFSYRVTNLVREVIGVILIPYYLFFTLPTGSEEIVRFIKSFTTQTEGVGHVCSFALFDLAKHGNKKYGASIHAAKEARTRGGKLEKSFISFKAHHPEWEETKEGKDLIDNILHNAPSPHTPTAPLLSLSGDVESSTFGTTSLAPIHHTTTASASASASSNVTTMSTDVDLNSLSQYLDTYYQRVRQHLPENATPQQKEEILKQFNTSVHFS